jgi:hypothetical protein
MDGSREQIVRREQEIESLHSRLEEHETLKKNYEKTLQQLQEKEAFNFALFQYSPVLTVVVDKTGKVIKSNKAKRASGDRVPNIGDTMYRDYAGKHNTNMFEEMLDSINNGKIKHYPELEYGDKILSITIAPFPGGAIITSQNITEQKRAEHDRIRLIDELRRALEEVETLRGLLPICAHCKRIRDDKGYWNYIEDYFSRHSMVDFSHTLCPECVKKFYPELWEKLRNKSSFKMQGAFDEHAHT